MTNENKTMNIHTDGIYLHFQIASLRFYWGGSISIPESETKINFYFILFFFLQDCELTLSLKKITAKYGY